MITGKEFRPMREVVAKGGVRAGGQYSPAVVANGFVFVSSQGRRRPDSLPDALADQDRQMLRLAAVLCDACTVLADTMNINAYANRFPEFDDVCRVSAPALPPACTTIGARLIGIQVEIDRIAVLPAQARPDHR